MASQSTISDMTLDGGVPCLDLINSGLDTNKGEVIERIHSYDDLLILAERVELLDKKTLQALSKKARTQPGKASNLLQRTIQARGIMTTVFGAIADQQPDGLSSSLLDSFNALISEAVREQRFVLSRKELVLSGTAHGVDLKQPLLSFVLSAYELLRNSDQLLIKRCGRCQWIFLDETKSHRRKWCNMQDCGSIEKAKRYYKRKRHLNKDL